jgi:hypothetical protein
MKTIPDKITPAYRCAVAYLVIHALRDAIAKNNGVYSMGLVPNLVSVTDVLQLPDPILLEQLKRFPQDLLPEDTDAEFFSNLWEGK